MTTFAAGQELFADDFDDLINPSRMGFRARRVANQSITSGAATAISWDTEDEDTNGFITVPSTTPVVPSGCAGIYVIMARQILSATPTSARTFLEINVTSSLSGITTDFRNGAVDGNESGRLVVTALIPLAVGDSFLVNTDQNSGGALNLTGLLTCYRLSV